jgi:hypothetical protein
VALPTKNPLHCQAIIKRDTVIGMAGKRTNIRASGHQ